MSLKNILKTTLVCTSFAVMAPAAASAVTIDFEGATSGTPSVIGEYQFSSAQIVGGNCASGSCLQLTPGETTTLSRVDSGTFSFTDLWFKLLGQTSELLITATTSGASLLIVSPTQTGTTLSLGSFTDVTSILFSNVGKGNIRIDDLVLNETPAPVPLPAGAGLMVVALGSLGALRRRRAAK